jgi:hypothetical protein
MTSDSGEREKRPPRPRFDLPKVTGIEIRRIAWEPPRRRNFESALPKVTEAVEFLVETEEPIPVRGLGPVLYVGDAPIVEVRADDATHYRFVGLQPDSYEPGAPLSLGWSGRPGERQPTPHRFDG